MNQLEKLEEAFERTTRLYMIEREGLDRSEVKAALTYISNVIGEQQQEYIHAMLSDKTAA